MFSQKHAKLPPLDDAVYWTEMESGPAFVGIVWKHPPGCLDSNLRLRRGFFLAWLPNLA